MTCRDVIEFLMEYAAGTVAAEEMTIFEAHLAICPPCVAYLKTYQVTVDLGRPSFDDDQDPDPPIPEELVAAVLAARRGAKASA